MRKKMQWSCLLVILVLGFGSVVYAAEHGGKEHGGTKPMMQEHGGKKVNEPSKTDIHNAMRNYIKEKATAAGVFEVYDPDIRKTRRLELARIHERVGKTGDYYYSCADFKDLDSGEMLDLDLDVAQRNGGLEVADVRIHKVNNAARYTYDENDNRIPIKKEK